jgi:predicted AlkP superfamily pyrophosphatase or phosphodiesterase
MTTEKAKHLVVISYDAFSEDNWETASRLPNLSALIQNGAWTTKLKSVYPTLTYVAHTTMVTGVYPDKHGIYHNNPFQPFVREAEQNWFWFRKDVKAPTVYDALKARHGRSGGVLWPVTGRAPIRYNIPEIRAIKNENQTRKMLKYGRPLFLLGMEKKFGFLRKGIRQPYLDDFTAACAADTIKRKKPDLLLAHLLDLDDAKHRCGTDSPEVEEAIARVDKHLGDILNAAGEAGIREDTAFLVVGDHGQINVRYKVRLNRLLREGGLIYEEKGEMKWRAYLQTCGGSAYLHLKENDSEAERLALDILTEAMGIEKIFDRSQLDDFHAAPVVRYMLEAKAGWCFDDGLDGPVVTDLEESGIRYATHGYSPDKPGYRCNLVISGACIKKGYQFDEAQMVDIAPTIAAILGIDFPECDGRPLNEIFRSGE